MPDAKASRRNIFLLARSLFKFGGSTNLLPFSFSSLSRSKCMFVAAACAAVQPAVLSSSRSVPPRMHALQSMIFPLRCVGGVEIYQLSGDGAKNRDNARHCKSRGAVCSIVRRRRTGTGGTEPGCGRALVPVQHGRRRKDAQGCKKEKLKHNILFFQFKMFFSNFNNFYCRSCYPASRGLDESINKPIHLNVFDKLLRWCFSVRFKTFSQRSWKYSLLT